MRRLMARDEKPKPQARPTGRKRWAPIAALAAWMGATRLVNAIREAIGGPSIGAAGVGADNVDGNEPGWRKLSGGKGTRDFQIADHAKMVTIAHWLYAMNCQARMFVDTQVLMTMGKRMGYTVAFDPEVLDIDPEEAKALAADARGYLDVTWRHPVHDIEGRAREYATTYLVTGDLLLPVVDANPVSGQPSLDIIDAELIESVRPVGMSSMAPGTVMVRAGESAELLPFDVLRGRPEDGLFAPTMIGEGRPRIAFYFRHNSVLNSMLGRSEYLDTADWFDQADQYLFSVGDRGLLRNSMVWDVTVQTSNPSDVVKEQREFAKAIAKGTGQIYAHNDKISVEAKSASIEATESADMARLFRTQVLGARNIPESWYGSGGETNRATAGEQGDVTMRRLIGLQEEFKDIFETILRYAYDQLHHKQPGKFPSRAEGGVKLEVTLPPVQEKDATRAASTMASLEASLEAAIEAELVSRKTARAAFLTVLGKVHGQDVDLDDELAQIEAEKAERDAARADKAQGDALAAYQAALAGQPEPDPEEPDEGDGGGRGPCVRWSASGRCLKRRSA